VNVSLTPELERFVQEKVESGRYTSASEVVREALRLLERKEQRLEEREAALRAFGAELDRRMAEADAGGWIDGEEAFEQLRAYAAARRKKTA
jgi:antitoxin ParD1/3/4